MGAEGGSYRKERRRDAAKQAAGMRGKISSMFFGASPDQRKGLRKTPEKKVVKLDDLDMNAVGREKYPEKVGENVRLIDIAMGKAPPPGPRAAPPTDAEPPIPVEPVRARRAPPSSRMGRAAASSMKVALQVQATLSKHVERICWGVAVLCLAAAFGAQPALEVLTAETAAEAATLRGAGWEAAAGQGTAAALAWARELGLVLACLAAWGALFMRQWRAFRSPSAIVEGARVVVMAGLPIVLLGAGALWVGGQLALPWGPPEVLTAAARSLAESATGLPLPITYLVVGLIALVSFLVARVRRRRRPLKLAA